MAVPTLRSLAISSRTTPFPYAGEQDSVSQRPATYEVLNDTSKAVVSLQTFESIGDANGLVRDAGRRPCPISPVATAVGLPSQARTDSILCG